MKPIFYKTAVARLNGALLTLLIVVSGIDPTTAFAAVATGARKNTAFRSSPLDTLSYAVPGYSLQGKHVYATDVDGIFWTASGRAPTRWPSVLLVPTLRYEAFKYADSRSTIPMLGAETIFASGRLYTAVGARLQKNSEYPKVEQQLQWSGALPGFEYGNIAYQSPIPIYDSSRALSINAYETRLTAYLETSGDWMSANFTPKLRKTNLAYEDDEAFGEELGAKIVLGKPEWRLGIGPWMYFLRWDPRSDVLDGLLPRRYNYVGPMAQAFLGPGKNGRYRIVLAGGAGYDRSLPEDDQRATFFESSADVLLTKAIGVSLSYNLYSGNVSAAKVPATRVLQLSTTGSF